MNEVITIPRIYKVWYAGPDHKYSKGWHVEKHDAMKSAAVVNTKSEAVRIAKKKTKNLADKQGYARLKVSKKNGQVDYTKDYGEDEDVGLYGRPEEKRGLL